MFDSLLGALPFRNRAAQLLSGSQWCAVSIYSDTVMEHFESPRNTGALDSPDAIGTCDLGGRGPSMKVFLRVAQGKVTAARFQTHGCGFSIAAGSLMTVLVTGRSLEECWALDGEALNTALGGLPPHKRFCADLAIGALQDALVRISTD
jgi:NifU-like protein involved in Fe-S cluster formation